jgi:mRNA interferase RelE/StbE
VSSAWKIRWEARALKEVSDLPKDDQRRIVTAVEGLAENPNKGTALKGKWAGLRRFRVGNYRVIYALMREELLIAVVRVGHRKDVYRAL